MNLWTHQTRGIAVRAELRTSSRVLAVAPTGSAICVTCKRMIEAKEKAA